MRFHPRFLSPLLASALVLAQHVHAADELHYLTPNRPDATTLLAPPPLPDSPEQAADLDEVRAVALAASPKEIAAARSEKEFGLFNFTPAIGDFFQPGRFPKTQAFLERVFSDDKIFVSQAKQYFNRPRPYIIDASLAAAGEPEKSMSYPSGHSTGSMVLALVLADLFPEKRDAIVAKARTIGWHRVQIARHYPTDIYAGRVFAQAIVREMKTNPQFQQDLAEAKAEIAESRVATAAH